MLDNKLPTLQHVMLAQLFPIIWIKKTFNSIQLYVLQEMQAIC